ncbi:hypothetical protein PIB30_036609 [Stylosanthes scabra]|uniref:Uncharacterized protein n=1 Tax=Stylosanthes scabra TaxID=79078 RepID=A0ABU6RDQ3_9FABA|nr:hypothetical protein [Stylosanthes scabra]
MFSRMYGGVSHKSDVYSYGMLILEMIGGRKNYDTGESHSGELYFPDWIYKDLVEGPLQSVPYPPKPEVSSPTRPPLPFSDASHSIVYETNSTEVND